jgi:Zn-finger nucleic acid-binding protein
MRLLAGREVDIDACPQCRSLWLDAGEYARVATVRAGRAGAGAPEADEAGRDLHDVVFVVNRELFGNLDIL